MSKLVKRGRPSKKVQNVNATFKVTTVKMNDLSFNDNLTLNVFSAIVFV